MISANIKTDAKQEIKEVALSYNFLQKYLLKIWNTKTIFFLYKIHLGTQNSPVNRLVLFHVISSKDYMLHLLKKLKLYPKLGPERVNKAPKIIKVKIYLWLFVDYQHLKKYFYNWNITLSYCSIYKIIIRGNIIWKYPWSGKILEI